MDASAQLLYGLRVDSVIELPVSRIEGRSDVLIRLGSVAPRGRLVWQIGDPMPISCYRDERWTIFIWPGVRFAISSDKVVVDAQNLELAAHLLLHVIWSIVLDERGQASLHGSAVERNGQAIAVLGQSGSGKSTAVLALLDRGWRLLSDDLLAFTGNGQVIPGPPFVRLTDDRAAGRAGGIDSGGKLRYYPDASPSPAPLAAIVVHDEQYVEPRQLFGTQALDALLRQVYFFLPPQPGQTQRRYALALDLIEHVPVYGVRPRSLTGATLERLAEGV